MLSSASLRIPSGLRKLSRSINPQRSLATISTFQEWRNISRNNMASPSKIHLTVDDTGIVKFKSQDEETAAKTSELLQKNHDNHHIFFSQGGFHNHIAHHLLSLYGLGAPASAIQRAYSTNASYQRPAAPLKEREVPEMSNPEHFKRYLGKEKHYHNFLVFFQKEMESKGWENVLNEYLFAGDERADDLLGRMYAGFLHPLIHLGFGIEFHQPAIIAEALAQAAIHDAWTKDFLLATEATSRSHQTAPLTSSETLPELLDLIRADKELSTAAHWSDNNKIRDGILVRASENLTRIAIQWIVSPQNLSQKTAEMINAAIYFTAAAQHPPKQVKFDFYYMHSANCSIFFPTFNAQSWLSEENKVRLLQWKGWLDLTMYASRRSPPLLLEEISMYTPKKLEAGDAEWKGIFNRLFDFDDDGHAVKLGRTVRNAELISQEWEGKEGAEDWMKIKGFMFEKIGNMVIDSVEDTGAQWARSVGFEEAWKDYEDRPRQVHL